MCRGDRDLWRCDLNNISAARSKEFSFSSSPPPFMVLFFLLKKSGQQQDLGASAKGVGHHV